MSLRRTLVWCLPWLALGLALSGCPPTQSAPMGESCVDSLGRTRLDGCYGYRSCGDPLASGTTTQLQLCTCMDGSLEACGPCVEVDGSQSARPDRAQPTYCGSDGSGLDPSEVCTASDSDSQCLDEFEAASYGEPEGRDYQENIVVAGPGAGASAFIWCSAAGISVYIGSRTSSSVAIESAARSTGGVIVRERPSGIDGWVTTGGTLAISRVAFTQCAIALVRFAAELARQAAVAAPGALRDTLRSIVRGIQRAITGTPGSGMRECNIEGIDVPARRGDEGPLNGNYGDGQTRLPIGRCAVVSGTYRDRPSLPFRIPWDGLPREVQSAIRGLARAGYGGVVDVEGRAIQRQHLVWISQYLKREVGLLRNFSNGRLVLMLGDQRSMPDAPVGFEFRAHTHPTVDTLDSDLSTDSGW